MPLFGEHAHGLLDHRQVVLGQRARIGTRIGQRLVPLVQALRQRQRRLGARSRSGRWPRAAATSGRTAAARPASSACDSSVTVAALPRTASAMARGFALGPDAVGLRARASSGGSSSTSGSNHLPGYSPASARKLRVDFPVVAADELADLLLALDHDGQRRRLHAAHRGQEEAAVARVEGGHRARAVDADQPVGLGARARGVGQARASACRCAARRSRRGSPAASSTAATAA